MIQSAGYMKRILRDHAYDLHVDMLWFAMKISVLLPHPITCRGFNESRQILDNVLPKSLTSNLDRREY
jgi:hypothetical protein